MVRTLGQPPISRGSTGHGYKVPRSGTMPGAKSSETRRCSTGLRSTRPRCCRRRRPAGRVGDRRRARSPIRTPSPRWRRGSPRSAPARRPSASGWSSTRRSTPPAPAPAPPIFSSPDRFPVFATGRGGQYTYHGPGQRVAYVMLDLNRRAARPPPLRRRARGMDHPHARRLQRPRRTPRGPDRRLGRPPRQGAGAEDKIAAIGIRVRRWVTFHGIALNVDPDLEHFSGIVPCGVRGHGVTSLADLGVPVSMAEVDAVLRREFEALFGVARPIVTRSRAR